MLVRRSDPKNVKGRNVIVMSFLYRNTYSRLEIITINESTPKLKIYLSFCTSINL